MIKPEDRSNVELEDIKAETAKSEARLIFSGVVLSFCCLGFIVKTCAAMPPAPIAPDPSIECAKVPAFSK